MKGWTLLALSFVALTGFSADPSPYAGEEGRRIKSMSPEEVAALTRGDGMGFAKAAELNQYPGPKHVLELADKLELSALQKEQTIALFAAMQAKAVELGKRLITAEAELDRLFAAGAIDGELLEEQVALIGELQSQLRFVHLEAHLQQKSILNRHQVARYVSLRGYHGGHREHH